MPRMVWTTVLGVAVAVVLAACSPQEDRMARSQDVTAPAGTAADPAAERRVIRLTGCLQEGVEPGKYTLASVGTAGKIGTTGGEESLSVEQQARVKAATSYELLTMDDKDFSAYVGRRVMVEGRLAHERTGEAERELPEQGKTVESGSTGATVVGEAPPLPGFWVDDVSKVADTCAPEQESKR